MSPARLRLLLLAAVVAVPVATPSRTIAAQSVPPVDLQVAAAVLPLPKEMRDGAGVLGYRTAGKLESLRPAKNGMLCLADDPAEQGYHASCYHESMEPFMLRGRQLRAAGTKGTQVDTVRFAEVTSGKLSMPTAPASLYQIFAPVNDFSLATGTVSKPRATFVVYIPFATAQSTGLSTTPTDTGPWLMLPGTPKAHIMFTMGM